MNVLFFVAPEIGLALAGCGLLIASAGKLRLPGASFWAALALGLTAALVAWSSAEGPAFSGMFVVDSFARYAKVLILCAAAASLALAPSYFEKTVDAKPEYAVLVLFAALGMMVMVSATDLVTLYAGMELQNLALYVLAAFRRDDPRASEAGLKYFVLGALSSAVFLFGASFLYGSCGSTAFDALSGGKGPVFALGFVFVVVGFAVKAAAAPFHMWAPDVYHGAPTPVTGFFLAAPKVAALVALARFLEATAQAGEIGQPIVTFLAVTSMAVGAFGGLAQTNLKRLMAYSAITNAGVMLVGLALIGEKTKGIGFWLNDSQVAGLSGTLLYLALYFAGTFALFAGLLLVRKDGKPVEEIRDLSGLFKTHPTLGAGLGAALFSLAGIPPLAGFFGKYKVLLAAVTGEKIWLAVAGVLASVVAAAFYARIVKVMAFDPPPEKPLELVNDRVLHAAFVLATLAVTFFLVMPAPLMNAAADAAKSLFQ